MRAALTLLALLAACSAPERSGPEVHNTLDTAVCVVQATPCDGGRAIDLVRPGEPLAPGASVTLPDASCHDVFVEPCDGAFIEVIAVDSASGDPRQPVRI